MASRFLKTFLAAGLVLAATTAPAGPIAWDGEENPARGKGWAQPATSRIAPAPGAREAGGHCLKIDLKGEGWKGAGWNWFGWFPPESGTDASGAADLVFRLKAARPDATLQVRLVDNRKGASALLDLRDAGLLKELPADWREVRVPLAALGEGFDRSRLWEIHFGTTSPGDLTVWVDDIGFGGEPPGRPRTGKPYAAAVVVEADRPLHAIPPTIYGVSAVDPKAAAKSGLSALRWGGNRSSRYNWEAGADNAGSDWFFLNGKVEHGWEEFDAGARRAGMTAYLTVPMLPWVAKGPEGCGFSVAKYGPQQKVEPYGADRGDGHKPDGTPIRGNDPRDTSVPSTPALQARGIARLVRDRRRHKSAGDPPTVYALDNEPMLWGHTHRDVHPEPPSYDEVFRMGRDLALAIKGADPLAEVAGPCSWGWTDLTYSALDAGSDHYATHADNASHGGVPFLAWYLGAMKEASKKAGRRLLDVADVHIYPQGQADGQGVYGGQSHSPAMRALRLRSTRALWDPSYKDESWINEPVALIPRVRGWIDQHNPGTKLALGEYSWGGDDDPSGAIAQAEILGILARERVDHAYFWAGLGGVQRFAFALYRNPEGDGRGQGFGQRYLASKTDAPGRLDAFAARGDDGALTIVLINADLDRPAEVRVDLGRKSDFRASARLFRLPNPPGPPAREDLAIRGRDAQLTLPPLTAALLVVP